MTIEETIKYFESMKNTALKDTDKRAAKCIEAIDSVLQFIDERRALQNRCKVLTYGHFCEFCPMECNVREYVFSTDSMCGEVTND